MGDKYGTGIKAKIGTMIPSFSPQFSSVPKSKTGTPPKELA
jgi:hypothetical protein